MPLLRHYFITLLRHITPPRLFAYFLLTFITYAIYIYRELSLLIPHIRYASLLSLLTIIIYYYHYCHSHQTYTHYINITGYVVAICYYAINITFVLCFITFALLYYRATAACQAGNNTITAIILPYCRRHLHWHFAGGLPYYMLSRQPLAVTRRQA